MSSAVPPDGAEGSSTRPYLIRALHEWCTDNGFTPFLAVRVGPGVRVPMEYVKNQEIVLNAGFEATSDLHLGNDFISFKARFGGVAREILVPVDHVVAIYARENGQGMAFPVPVPVEAVADGHQNSAGEGDGTTSEGKAGRGLRLATVVGDSASEPEVPRVPSIGPARGSDASDSATDVDPMPPSPPTPGRPALKRIK